MGRSWEESVCFACMDGGMKTSSGRVKKEGGGGMEGEEG